MRWKKIFAIKEDPSDENDEYNKIKWKFFEYLQSDIKCCDFEGLESVWIVLQPTNKNCAEWLQPIKRVLSECNWLIKSMVMNVNAKHFKKYTAPSVERYAYHDMNDLKMSSDVSSINEFKP